MTGPVVLYFTAPWCAPCKRFAPVVDKIAAELELSISRLDIDTPEGARMAASYGVSSVPTVIVAGEREVLARFGVLPPAKVRERLEALA